MTPRLGVAALSALVFVVAAGPAQAAPDVFAHRGGAYVRGKPQFPENTLPAFGVAALQRDPLEFDIKLTADGVPVVIHDPALDRTTNCSGRVVDKTLAQLRRCRADVLGVPGSGLPTRHVADPSVGVPTLGDVLALGRRTGSTVVPEIKNYPTDSDYDPTLAFAAKATAGIAAGGIPLDRVIVDSVTTENLDVVQSQLPGAQTSLLALQSGNAAAIPLAVARNDTWVSPEWPVDGAYVGAAHAGGRRVVPYTIDTADQMSAAGATGVDALITNDPTLAHETLGVPFPADVQPLEPFITDTSIRVRRGEAAVRVRCRAPATATCVGNLTLSVRHRGAVGRAQFAIAAGRAQTLRVGVRRSVRGRGVAALSAFDERGKPAVGRQSITLG